MKVKPGTRSVTPRVTPARPAGRTLSFVANKMSKHTRRRASNRIGSGRTQRGEHLHAMAGHVLPTAPAVTREMWRARRPKLVALALILLATTALLAFFNTDLFYVFDFQITGLKYLSSAEVERASGIAGYNIFFIESQAVERALSRMPEVKSVRVTSSLPNRVVIEVEERQPQVTWLRGSESYWVGADDIAFRARMNLPKQVTLRDLDQSPVKLGQKVSADGMAATRALRDAWPDAPRVLEWSASRGLAFDDEHGWKIYLGDAIEMAGKVASYRALASQLTAQNIKIRFIDLSKGDPYYQ
jgi:cell division septal protein FtsQ